LPPSVATFGGVLADRRTVALGSAPFIPYGRNLDRPTVRRPLRSVVFNHLVGRRDDAVVGEARVVEASDLLQESL